MLSQGWQIGLHINTARVSIVAVKAKRNRWSLQRYWLFTLKEPVFTLTGLLVNTGELRSILQVVRRQLPYRYSLRISFPTQCVLHRTLPLPTTSLTGGALERFVQLSVERLFSHLHELTWDYALGPNTSTEISVTVTRYKTLNEYCALFKGVGLNLEVVELASSALYPLLATSNSNGLIVEDNGIWLWAVHQPPYYYHGQFLREQVQTPAAVREAIHLDCENYCYAGEENEQYQELIKPFISPLLLDDSLHELSSRHELTVALGLALREGDQL